MVYENLITNNFFSSSCELTNKKGLVTTYEIERKNLKEGGNSFH